MIPAPHRMRRGADFEAAVRRGRRAGCRTLVVHAVVPCHGELSPSGSTPGPAVTPRGPEESAAAAVVGFVVSRSVGPAVVRNRVKRRLRHLVQGRVASLPAGARVVVRANPPSAQASWDVLQADLDALLSRVLAPTGGRRGGRGTPGRAVSGRAS